ncbi:MAG: hypothetical protein ACI86H_002335 [bacterium]|jgi:hypothetical protein
MKKLHIFFLPISIYLSFFLSSILANETTYIVQGKILADANAISKIPIVLFRISIKDQKMTGPYMKAKTDEKGNYKFVIKSHLKGYFYRVGAFVKGQGLASDSIFLIPAKSLITVNLVAKVPPKKGGLHNIYGKILASDPSVVSKISVVLFQLSKNKKLRGPFMKTKTDESGNYQFKNIPSKDNVFYRVGAFVKGQGLSSKAILFSSNQKNIKINLTLPVTVQGFSALKVTRQRFVIEPLDGLIRVTSLIGLYNPTKNILDGRKEGIQVSLPKNAKNFRSPDILYRTAKNQASIQILAPQGRKMVFFQYEIPIKGSSSEISFPLFSGTKIIELLTPFKGVNAFFSNYAVNPTIQYFGKKNDKYIVKNFIPKESLQSVKITIEGIPMSHQIFYIPAIALLIILLGGITIYAFRVKKI